METTAASRCPLCESGMTEAVIGSALVAVHQDIVGFAQFLEFFLSLRVVRVLVRVEFHRKLAVSTLYLVVRCVAGHREDLVVIAFLSHRKAVMFSEFMMRLPRALPAKRRYLARPLETT